MFNNSASLLKIYPEGCFIETSVLFRGMQYTQDLVGCQLKLRIFMISCIVFLCRGNIVEAHTQVLSLLKSEYSPEEIQGVINMTSIQDLQMQLDSLL